MSTPMLTSRPPSNIPHAQPPVGYAPHVTPAAEQANREEATRQRGGALRRLFRMNREPEAVDVKRVLDAQVESTFAKGDDRSSRHRFRAAAADIRGQPAAQDAMAERECARAEIESMFEGISPRFIDQLLDKRETSDIPIYGHAPRYAQAIVLATALAQATGGDAQRAQDVMNAWNLQAESDPARFTETVQADDLATQCLLAKTELGWDILTAFAPSRYVRLGDTDDERRHMSTALRACAHLLENLPFEGEGFPRPRDLNEASMLAKSIVDQGQPAPNDDEPLPDANPAMGFERNVIAARALMGSLSTSPSRKEREAILLFKPRGGERDIGNVSTMRHRLNQLFSDHNEKRGLFGRMPTMNQRVMDTLAKRTMSELVEHLEEVLAPPLRMENGVLAPDPDFVAPLTDDRVRTALHFTALKAFIDRVDHRTRRASIDLKGGEFKELLDATARKLEISPKELSRHPAWQEAYAECKQLNVDKLRAWMREVDIDPATSDLGEHLRTLDRMQQGKASNAQGVRELVNTMRPGSSIAFTSRGATGPNVTLWATIAPEAWKHKWGHPTITPLPTGSRIRGRGAAVVLSGDEGPDGAQVDIDSGTFDRKSWTILAGAVAQIHSEDPAGASQNFWWQVFEYGWHGSQETSEGVKLRITADKFDEAKRLAGKVLETLAGMTPSEEGDDEHLDGWDGLVDKHYDADYISVHRQTREEKLEKGRIAQTMTVLGQNTPFGASAAIPHNKWIAGGVNSWWNAFAMQFSRTKATLKSQTRGADDIAQTSTRREQHTTLGGLTYPQPSLLAPGQIASTSVSGGLGAWWLPMKRFVKGLESGEAMLCLPPPGSNGTPYQEWAMTELEYIEWQTQLFGASSPTPPEHMQNHILPDRPQSARGGHMVVVRRYATPEAAARLRSTFDRIATMSGDPTAGPTIQREMDRAGARLLDESTWSEDMVVSYEYTNQQERVSGMPPIAYQKQRFVGTVERDRQHVLGRTGGRNTVIGTRVPEKSVPDEENARIFRRNMPTRFAPALPGVQQSPMQQLIRKIFAGYAQEWRPVDPVLLPSHMQIYGPFFHLIQMRARLYPQGTPIGDALHALLRTTDSMAMVDCDPKHSPAEIMVKFERLRREYAIRHIPEGETVPDNLDELKDEFWKDLDVASFFADNFYPPLRPLAHKKPQKPIRSMKDHVEEYREINKLDMSPKNVRPGSSTVPLEEVADSPSPRFKNLFQWDQEPTSKGQMADKKFDSVRRTILNKRQLIDEQGIDPNANGTHYSGRQQPETLAIIVGNYVKRTGDRGFLVECLPQMMKEWFNRMRGAENLMPGTIFNGVAMKPDGDIISALIDYGTPLGARPEGYAEDNQIADEELARLDINRAYTFGEQRNGAAIGTDFNKAQRSPVDGRRELTYSAPLAENAHMLKAERVIIEALREAGHHEMADLMEQFNNERLRVMQKTYLVPRTDTTLKPGSGARTPMMVGSYYRLREGELHPLLSAEIANALWAGIVPPEDIEWAVKALESLTTPDGLMATADVDSDEQWDGFNFWAMHAMKAVEGLLDYGQVELAERIALGFMKNAQAVLAKFGITAEKYNPNGQVGRGGEYPVEPNMTMTNETLAYFASLFKSCEAVYKQPLAKEPVTA